MNYYRLRDGYMVYHRSFWVTKSVSALLEVPKNKHRWSKGVSDFNVTFIVFLLLESTWLNATEFMTMIIILPPPQATNRPNIWEINFFLPIIHFLSNFREFLSNKSGAEHMLPLTPLNTPLVMTPEQIINVFNLYQKCIN